MPAMPVHHFLVSVFILVLYAQVSRLTQIAAGMDIIMAVLLKHSAGLGVLLQDFTSAVIGMKDRRVRFAFLEVMQVPVGDSSLSKIHWPS
jgi:hypothetical protein